MSRRAELAVACVAEAGNDEPLVVEVTVDRRGDDVHVEGRIVFSMRGEFPKGRPPDVIRLDELQDQYPVVEKGPGAAAAAFADVWDRIRTASQPNPLAH